jgi:hypothetical protein
MKAISIIRLFLLIGIFLVSLKAETCNNCTIIPDLQTGVNTKHLSCILPNMPTFPITAQDVLRSDGTLKEYWPLDSYATVCTVLEWFN